MTSSALARVALVTCAELPDLDADTRLLADALSAGGIDSVPAVWSDAQIDWRRFDLPIVRTCWDYAPRRDAFIEWATRLHRVANSAAALRWNTDKRYLALLAARGVPIVPTQFLEPGEVWNTPRGGEWVVKPAVSASAMDTARYHFERTAQREAASAHAGRLSSAGRTAMVQPYQRQIDEHGETSLMFFDGEFSHAVRKDAVLASTDAIGDQRLVPGGGEGLRACVPTASELQVANQVLRAVPAELGPLLFARVDLVPGPDGAPLLMELEITEPELFLRMDNTAPGAFARAVERALARIGPTRRSV